MIEHNPKTTRRITQTEALEILHSEHERGHVHSAFFKDAMLNRFFSLCNCCTCYCGGMEMMKRYGEPMMSPSGYVAKTNPVALHQLWRLRESMPVQRLVDKEKKLVMDYEKCMGCGACVDKCPKEAKSLARDENKGIPLDVRAMA